MNDNLPTYRDKINNDNLPTSYWPTTILLFLNNGFTYYLYSIIFIGKFSFNISDNGSQL